ncbi:hypothetical protein DCO58_04345 [Helicobacter saguini]|nr:hypothetical protein [Helicobacter saguini]MWV62414.1 hypothetical protein [Helicobacter saguini]MWV66914.1 hypothetical protein [Helicobacter saguini]MWV71182.1 hypothetical protein [Helicobacter saguini]
MKNKFKPQRFRILQHNSDIIISIEKSNLSIDIKELLSIINIHTKQDKQSLDEYNIFISFYGVILQGGIESNNDLLFGNLDSNNELLESKPIYYLQDSIDSKDSTQTLQVFLDSKVLTILNYSLLESSLNIKLESKSKEAKKILSKELDCHDFLQKSRNDEKVIESTAMLCPILEDNEIKCPHNGIVKLKSNKGKNFKSNNKSMILESDLLNSQIIGCQNTILGVPTPCNLVSVILPAARALKKYNDDYPIMQDLVAGNIFTDKGFPLIITPKPNTFKINSPKPTLDSKQNLDSIESSINLTKPSLRVHYKIDRFQKDNLPVYVIKLNDKIIESSSENPLDSININMQDLKDLNKIKKYDYIESNFDFNDLDSKLKQEYENYDIKSLDLQLDSNLATFIFVIPQKIPKIFKKAYEDYKDKEYGVGRFQYLYNYCKCKEIQQEDYTKVGLNGEPLVHYIITLLSPAKLDSININLANGLDKFIESNKDSNTLRVDIINVGYNDSLWGEKRDKMSKDKDSNLTTLQNDKKR